jgi:hypothetical protein
MSTASRCLVVALLLAVPSIGLAQTYSPTVTMSVTAPDGQSHELTARDSSTATLKTKDGTEYLFRPTVVDEPFTKVTVAIFTADSTALGEVQVVKGASAVDSKTKPAFKIAVKAIELKK